MTIAPTYFTGQSRIGAFTPTSPAPFSEHFRAALRDIRRSFRGARTVHSEEVRSALSEAAYEAASERFDPVAGAGRRGG